MRSITVMTISFLNPNRRGRRAARVGVGVVGVVRGGVVDRGLGGDIGDRGGDQRPGAPRGRRQVCVGQPAAARDRRISRHLQHPPDHIGQLDRLLDPAAGRRSVR